MKALIRAPYKQQLDAQGIEVADSPSGTTWRGQASIRLSVSNWQTTHDDVDRSVAALARAARDTAPVAQGA